MNGMRASLLRQVTQLWRERLQIQARHFTTLFATVLLPQVYVIVLEYPGGMCNWCAQKFGKALSRASRDLNPRPLRKRQQRMYPWEEYDNVQGNISYRNERSTPKQNPKVRIWCAVKVYIQMCTCTNF